MGGLVRTFIPLDPRSMLDVFNQRCHLVQWKPAMAHVSSENLGTGYLCTV